MCKCYECAFLTVDKNDEYVCNGGDSMYYCRFVNANMGCDDGECEFPSGDESETE